MTALDTRFVALALNMISKNGKSVLYYPVKDDTDGSAYNVVTGTIDESEGASITAKCIVVVSGKAGRTGQDVSQAGVRQFDRFIYMPGAVFSDEPKAEDKITFDSISWRVLATMPFYSGEQVALWGIYLKRAA